MLGKQLANQVYKKLQRKYLHFAYFVIFFFLGIFEILNIMTELGVQLENNTLEFYSLKFITNIDPENVIYKLKEMNMKIVDILTPLSAVLLRQNRISDTADIGKFFTIINMIK